MSLLVVKPHRPWRNRLIIAGVTLGVLLSGWGLFEYGRARAGFDAIAAQEEQGRLQQQTQDLQNQLTQLHEEKAILERSAQIDRKAYKDLEGTVSGLQAEISEYKGELAFYRGIVSPRDAQQGLRVESFEVSANGAENGFRYKLVLTQVLKSDRLARGKVSLEVEGLQNGQNKVLSLQDIAADDGKILNFNFKYFQNFEGDIKLPAGFVPLRVVVKVDPLGNADKVEKSFDWPVEEG